MRRELHRWYVFFQAEDGIRDIGVTGVQTCALPIYWSEQERGAPGKFSFQLILDSGAEEYAIRPPAEDADVLMDLFKRSDTIYFDMGRQVLIFGDISLG